MIHFRLVIHSLLLNFSRNSSSCSYSCDRIKQSQLLVLRLSLDFDNRYHVYCDTLQILNAYKTFIIQLVQEGIKSKQIIGGKFTSKKNRSPKTNLKMSNVLTLYLKTHKNSEIDLKDVTKLLWNSFSFKIISIFSFKSFY